MFIFQERRNIHRKHEHTSGFRIRRGRAPIRAAVISGHLNGVGQARRSEETLVDSSVDGSFPLGAFGVGQKIGIQVGGGESLFSKGWRRGGKWLSGRGDFARHVRLRDGAFFDGPQRLAGDAIKDIEKAILGRLGHDGNFLAIVADIQ